MEAEQGTRRTARWFRGSARRSRWAAIGAAVAVALGSGGVVGASAGEPPAGNFVAVAPCRVVDTRAGSGNVGARATPLGAGETYSTAFVGAVGRCTIPATATAVVLSLVVVNPTAGSYLTVFPAGGAVPVSSNLNYVAGQAPVANSATVQLGAGGQLSFFNFAGTVDVVVDVAGYYVPASSRTEQLAFGARALRFYSTQAAPASVNNCLTTSTGAPFGVIPLDLPVGATIGSIGAAVFDAASASTYTVGLYRQHTATNGITEDGPLLQITGGSATNTVVTGIASGSSTFAVTATDSYWLEVNLGTALTNAFCSASVTITRP